MEKNEQLLNAEKRIKVLQEKNAKLEIENRRLRLQLQLRDLQQKEPICDQDAEIMDLEQKKHLEKKNESMPM